MRTGEWAVAAKWRLCSTTVVRGVLHATSFISSDRSLLRDTSGAAASAFSVFIPAGFFQ